MAVVYDGDPRIIYSSGNVDLSIIGGQPEMDEGLENSVTSSLFFDSDWWGNAPSIVDESGPVGSKFIELTTKNLTNKTRQDAEAIGNNALAWMVANGIAESATVEASIPAIGMLGITVTIVQPSRTITIRYQLNWSTMEARVL